MTPSRTLPTSSEERFRRAFEAHYQPLYAYAASRLTERAAADDVVAEVFATAWRRVEVLPGEPETRPWLFGVARNVLRNAQEPPVALFPPARSSTRCGPTPDSATWVSPR